MITFHAYDTATISTLRAGGPDVYGNPAERATSDGKGKPCRCCLNQVPDGADMLIAAARPFPDLHPYAETGPIFLCADDCDRYAGDGVPDILRTSVQYLLKGYSADHRIVYGTGQITPASDVSDYAEKLLDMDDVAFVDVRSATNNCFLTRITRTI